jgi:hypothetical protein
MVKPSWKSMPQTLNDRDKIKYYIQLKTCPGFEYILLITHPE